MKSIQEHLTVTLLAGFALLLGSGGAAIYFGTRSALYREFDASIHTQADILSGFVKIERLKLEFEFPKSFGRSDQGIGRAAYYELFRTNGESVVKAPALQTGHLPARFGAQPQFWDIMLPNGKPGRAIGIVFQPKYEITKLGARVTPGSEDEADEEESDHPDPRTPAAAREQAALPQALGLVLAVDRTQLEHTLHRLAMVVLVAGGLTLLATATLVPLVLRRGLTPLRHLAAQAHSIDAKSLGSRFPGEGLPAELAPITERLNELLARLEKSFERERRFSADLAHELRTPVAALRTTAEVALKYGDTADRESFTAVLDISRQLEAIVGRLLALARAEQGMVPHLPSEPVELASLVQSLWEPLKHVAAARRITANLEVATGLRLETDPALLRAIVGNLLSNAAEYTPEQGHVSVTCTVEDAQFELCVCNSVENLEPADLPMLFERFWRKDKARSDSEHAGLGLSLARSFAELLGFSLEAALESGAGELKMTLRGPVRTKSSAVQAATAGP